MIVSHTVHLKVIQFLIRGHCSSPVLLTLGLLNLHCLASLGRRLGNLDVPGGPTPSLRLRSEIPCSLLPQRNQVLANQVGFPNKWRVLTVLSYTLDRKLGDSKSRFHKDRRLAHTGANPWSAPPPPPPPPPTGVLDTLRRREFGRLACKSNTR
ncbi:hypothetical protein HPB47_017461 [Ixodes persulcatus]|uniref:Uncharacterized protein n=1 Tax=Ixodes persulcatus TaxID=34615 RepID=A0AC60QQS6_IXOPE|nr:hypothetical protein HPB47_017461 [Ixodes persulcatus]